MKNYILTFTNDAIEYDMERQQESIKQELAGDHNYFSRINEEISFERIDEEVEAAIRQKFDNFVCLAEDEDIDLLQDGLNAEYGQYFDEILVIPEAFERLYEGDQTAPADQNNNQQNNNQQNNNQQQPQSNGDLTALFDQHFANCNITIDDPPKSGDPIDMVNWDSHVTQLQSEATNLGIQDKLNEGQLKYLTIAYVVSKCTKYNGAPIMVNFINSSNQKTSYTLDFANDQTLMQAAKNPSLMTLQSNVVFSLPKTDSTGKSSVVSLDAKGTESRTSQATNIELFLIDTSYPFKDMMTQSLSKMKEVAAGLNNSQDTDIFYMVCGPLPNQQFLLTKHLFPLAKAIPDESQQLETMCDAVAPEDSRLQCGVPTQQNVTSAVSTSLKKCAPNARSVHLHIPETLKGLGAISSVPGFTEVTANVDLPAGFDAQKNIEVFKAAEQLAMDKDNNYVNCPSAIKKDFESSEKKDSEDFVAEIQGKDKKELEKYAKDLGKNAENDAIQTEILSGWPVFVKTLIEATIQYKQNPQEQNVTPEEAKKATNEFLNAVLEPFKNDAKSWKGALDACGWGVMLGWVAKAAKALMKNKNDPNKKKVEDLENLIITDAYKTIKVSFGGQYDDEGIKNSKKNKRKAEKLQNTTNAQEETEKASKDGDKGGNSSKASETSQSSEGQNGGEQGGGDQEAK